MSGNASGWVKARNKITDGTDWRGTVAVPMGDETIDIGHRLLHESEFFTVKQAIDLGELAEYEDEAMDGDQERLQELQAKDAEELSERETEELEDLSKKLAVKQSEIEQKLGEDVYEKLLWAGEKAIAPTSDDISNVMSDLELQKQMFGEAIEGGQQEFEERIKADMEQMVVGQPYPIKYMIGQTAYKESMQLLGNGETSG